MGKAPADQFFWADWLRDEALRKCRCSTKGVWIDLLAFMWDAPTRGELEFFSRDEMARMVGATNGDLEGFFEDAERHKFCHFSVTRDALSQKSDVKSDVLITVRNRRMYRVEKAKQSHRLRQKKYRNKHNTDPPLRESDAGSYSEVTSPSSSSSSIKNLLTTENRHFSQVIKDSLDDIERDGKWLYSRGFKYVWKWIQQKSNQEGHPGAIAYVLAGMRKGWESVRKPWPWAERTWKTVEPNFREKDGWAEADKYRGEWSELVKDLKELHAK